MPKFREFRTALKVAPLGFMTGIHCIAQTVWNQRQDFLKSEEQEALFKALNAFLKRAYTSPEVWEAFAHFINEESLFPFTDQWPQEDLFKLSQLIKGPLLLHDTDEETPHFRYKEGYKDTLSRCAREQYLNLGDIDASQSLLDHWLLLIINTAFYAGTIIAARHASDPQIFREAFVTLEEESEAWCHYDQLTNILDKEVSRHKEYLFIE